MATVGFTEADIRIRDAVMRTLEWDPDVDASAIGVAAHDGAVTLTGYIDTYAGKLGAERAAKRVHGVRAVANDLDVRLKVGRTDADIAEDAARALTLRSTIPETVQAAVHDASLTLTGTVPRLTIKKDAEMAVRHIAGVRTVRNHIHVVSPVTVGDVRRHIVRALHESADVDARHVSVSVAGDVATLTGTVSTWLQRQAAERAASHAPGIARVINEIAVEPAADRQWEPIDEMC